MPYTSTHPSLPFQSHSETSRDAALRMVPHAHTQLAMVMAWFSIRGEFGGTRKELEEQCGLKPQSASARMADMKARGWIVETKQRRCGCAVHVQKVEEP